MKNEKYNSRIFNYARRFGCIILCLLVCLSTFIVASFAASDNNIDFSPQPIPVVSSLSKSSIVSDGLIFGTRLTYNNYIASTYSDFYIFYRSPNFFICKSGDLTNDNISLSEFGLAQNDSSVNYFTFNNTNLVYNSTYDISYFGSNTNSINTDIFSIPVYSDLNDALSDLRNFLDNSSSSDPYYSDLPDFMIQHGYAAYIDFGSDYSSRSVTARFNSSFSRYSNMFTNNWSDSDNRRYFWTSSLPSNTNFSSNVGSAIPWIKVEPFDILKRSKTGYWSIGSGVTPQNRYLVIVNPNLWSYSQQYAEDQVNSAITVSDLSGSTGDVHFFALNQSFDSSGTLVSSTNDDSDNNGELSYDPDSGSYNSSGFSGNGGEQNPGGDNTVPQITSINDYIRQLTDTISSFANNLLNLLQQPISHIQNMIQAGSGFMSALRGMYAWMPVEIQGIVISALTLVITIGVLKVFL